MGLGSAGPRRPGAGRPGQRGEMGPERRERQAAKGPEICSEPAFFFFLGGGGGLLGFRVCN